MERDRQGNFVIIVNIVMVCCILAFLLTGCALFSRGGNVKFAGRNIGESTRYSEKEIKKAMDVAEKYFKNHFEGCTLIKMEYDEAVSSEKVCRSWAQQYEAKEAIVLTSEFKVDEKGGDGSFNPNSTYTRWQWILVKNALGGWELKTWGY